MTGHVLIVSTGTQVAPALLADAITDAATRWDAAFVEALVPAVLPPTLPITACPPRLIARLTAQRDAAARALGALRVPGRVEIVPCRSVQALLRAGAAPDTLILVGRAAWRVRRAAHGVAPRVVTLSPTPSPRSPRRVVARPKALPE